MNTASTHYAMVPAVPYPCDRPLFEFGVSVSRCTGTVTRKIDTGAVLLPTYCDRCYGDMAPTP